MLTCIIIEDEPLAQEVLQDFIGRDEGLRVIRSFSNAPDARAWLLENNVEVIFLDIEMPEMSGIGLLKSLPNPPITVFTTAFRDYAFEGFELGVIDFLLKPFSYNRFKLAIDRIRDFISLRSEDTQLEQQNKAADFIFVKSGVNRIRLAVSDITHIQGLKDYAIIHTLSGKIVIKGSVKSVQQLFPAKLFIRTHKSFIVAVDKVKRIERNKIIIGQNEIPIGRNYKADVEQKLYK